jgi:hypothetical protein
MANTPSHLHARGGLIMSDGGPVAEHNPHHSLKPVL